MYSFDFLCLWQDQILLCILQPAKTPTMILVDESPMDEDEHLDFADQEPLPSPTL
jgi:hypothetical protein